MTLARNDFDRRPEVPLQVITPAEVRASISRARRSLEKAADEIVWQIEMEGWRTLGYSSWTAMREAEYGGAAVMLPSGSRPQVTERLKAIQLGTTARGGPKHLTDQEIADTLGVSRSRVQDDLNGNNKKSSSGQSVASKPEAKAAPEDEDAIDAEIVDESTFSCWSCEKSYPLETRTETEDGPLCGDCLDVYDRLDAGESGVAEPARGEEHPASAAPETREQTKPRRQRPLEQGFFDATMRLNKAVTSLENLGKDDRLPRNKEQVARYRNDLLLAIDALQRVADQLN